MRELKNIAKNSLRTFFEVGQNVLNINFLPKHFYSDTPNIAELKQDSFWKKPMTLIGVQGSAIQIQQNFVEKCRKETSLERLAKKNIHEAACKQNGESGYGKIEAEFLHCFIQSHKPKKIIQIGCGVSTSIILQAAKESQYTPKIIAVEPYPTLFLQEQAKLKNIELLAEKAQKVDYNILADLEAGDFLFIDSTHTVKPGSEVNYLILEVLPRLKKGVFVHFHDIYFPYDYQRGLISSELFFNKESTLLHAFLACNTKFTICAALSMLHYEAPAFLQTQFPNYIPQANDFGLRKNPQVGEDFPSAIYLEVIA
jgi:predicted O-methyltransferase YrrM